MVETLALESKRVNIPHRFKKIYKHQETAPSTPTTEYFLESSLIYRLDKFSKKISCTDFARFFGGNLLEITFFPIFIFLY